MEGPPSGAPGGGQKRGGRNRGRGGRGGGSGAANGEGGAPRAPGGEQGGRGARPQPRPAGAAAPGAPGVQQQGGGRPATEGGGQRPRQRQRGGRPPPGGGQAPGAGPGAPGVPRPQQQQQQQHQAAPAAAPLPRVSPTALKISDPSFMTATTFRSLNLHPLTQQAIDGVLQYELMTMVQEASLPACLSGRDVLARAKTGTGKTLAFLIPSIERLARAPGGVAAGGVHVMVLSPTRELAMQISNEAEALLTHHTLSSQVVYGGTNMRSEQTRMATKRCDILVATPGRLVDHIQNTPGFAQRLRHVCVAVLDEADQLLDMGFRDSLDKIIAALPPTRQTLLFSATLPPSVRSVATAALKRDHVFIDTVGDDAQQTNSQVRQCVMVAPFEAQIPALVHLVRHAASVPNHKVLAFFPTARATQFHAELLNIMGTPVLEIHSRKSQSQRERASAAFRAASSAILFSSDVSARGVDYPDVTAVIQVGAPTDRSQYIHRLGRTARAGKQGDGVLLLAPFDTYVLRELSDLPITPVDFVPPSPVLSAEVARGLAAVDGQTAAQCFGAWLGEKNGSLRKLNWDKVTLVRWANAYSATLGCRSPPPLPRKTVGKMGLKGVPGLIVE